MIAQVLSSPFAKTRPCIYSTWRFHRNHLYLFFEVGNQHPVSFFLWKTFQIGLLEPVKEIVRRWCLKPWIFLHQSISLIFFFFVTSFFQIWSVSMLIYLSLPSNWLAFVMHVEEGEQKTAMEQGYGHARMVDSRKVEYWVRYLANIICRTNQLFAANDQRTQSELSCCHPRHKAYIFSLLFAQFMIFSAIKFQNKFSKCSLLGSFFTGA